VCHNLIGTVHLLQSRTDDAIVWFEKARSALPGIPAHRSRLASAYALRGDIERATAELAEARRLAVDGRFSSMARLKAFPGPWWGRRTPAHCSNPPISPGCARPECRRNDRHCRFAVSTVPHEIGAFPLEVG
jgi:hypothetical protein